MFWNFLASYRRIFQPSKPNYQIGFGLVELMVSVSIIVIVIGVILIKQNTFNSAVLLRSQAYEIALRAREIQLSAVSASNDSGDFRSILGLHFSSDTSSNGNYVVFHDSDNDGFFDAGEQFDAQGILGSRFEIREIRLDGVALPLINQGLSVIFVRPNFDARFFTGAGNEAIVSMVEIDVARRGVPGAGNDVLRTVEITATGQIGVI